MERWSAFRDAVLQGDAVSLIFDILEEARDRITPPPGHDGRDGVFDCTSEGSAVDAYEFVAALKKSVREGVDHEVDLLETRDSPRGPVHLIRFANWIQGLSAADREVLRELLHFTAEGSLFLVLTLLDNLVDLTAERVRFELWAIAENGGRGQINDPDGDMLCDIFNGLG